MGAVSDRGGGVRGHSLAHHSTAARCSARAGDFPSARGPRGVRMLFVLVFPPPISTFLYANWRCGDGSGGGGTEYSR